MVNLLTIVVNFTIKVDEKLKDYEGQNVTIGIRSERFLSEKKKKIALKQEQM